MKLFMPDQISLLIVQCVMPAQWLQQVVQAGTGTSPLVETNSAALCCYSAQPLLMLVFAYIFGICI